MNLKCNLKTDLRERQEALELESVSLGQKNYYDALSSNRDEGETLPGMRLLRQLTGVVETAIMDFMETAESGKAGRKHIAYPYLARIDPLQAAYIACRVAVNGAVGRMKLQKVALSIADACEDHLELLKLAQEKKGLYKKVEKQLRKSTSATHRKAVYGRVIAKYSEKAVTWSAREKMLLGSKLLELVEDSTGLIERVTMTERGHSTPIELHLTPKALEVLGKGHEQCSLLQPVHMPMLVPPKDWKNPYSGGYVTGVLKPRLVRTSSRDYLTELGNHDLSAVYSALNAIQATPWQVNVRVLEVVKDLWDMGRAGGAVSPIFPPLHDKPLEPRPEGVPEDTPFKDLNIDQQEALKLWKIGAAEVHEFNASRKSSEAQMGQKLYMADRFKGEDAIYFPHSLDFRGRVYPYASYLNPQGDDVAKALLRFAEGKPLGDHGAWWLAVHIANCAGVDKVSFDDRVAWVMEHEEQILEAALDPVDGDRWWETMDSPACFLAACFEWAGYKMHGDAWVSHLPIAMDGSCSGLQHFSAMLRDEVGGAEVNLRPLDKPGDVYTKVSNTAQALSDDPEGRIERLNASKKKGRKSDMREVTELDRAMSEVWRGKFKRSIAKQPTMTLCYAATQLGMADQIGKALSKEADDYLAYTKEYDHKRCSLYAAEVVWAALGIVVDKARLAMAWLQDTSRVLSKLNMPVRWTTPMGLPVSQDYRVEQGTVVEAFFAGTRVQLTLVSDTDKRDGRKQALGIAPNFVHSMDGAHLMRTAVLGREAGIDALAVIHDSFGTHAADTETLHEVIREAFIQQYTPNVLENFRNEVVELLEKLGETDLIAELPPTPPMGNLDLEDIRRSDYLFA
ncbi:DNA-directed RNA polymerase [Stenotrophomonas maltophilia]|uniref:DNA-directed RNA polymerase n=1 Tax=Stenotrophomonas maltophilia TaxID=40324 RepID=UPI0020900CFD|nr:DNA-directed RNA polymerase [Stenotrophomonas maltophilia]MCO5735955.1 T3/T7 RNA polymerase [Stenotrophomonas maltophilia]